MKTDHHFVVCIRNPGYEASLELFKLRTLTLALSQGERENRAIPGDKPESHGYLRVVDEDGEDYWYPSDWFHAIELPRPVEQALLAVK